VLACSVNHVSAPYNKTDSITALVNYISLADRTAKVATFFTFLHVFNLYFDVPVGFQFLIVMILVFFTLMLRTTFIIYSSNVES